MDKTSVLYRQPLIFRYQDAKDLAGHISNRRSIVLIGITRVGIGNFLSFFINRKDVVQNYFQEPDKHLFIPVNLNDLIECDVAPFWTLTLKRVVDSIENSNINEDVKKEIRGLFLESIQLQDLFFTIDSVRLSIKKIIEEGLLPTIFFIKFDRLKNVLTPQLFANLEGLREFTHYQLAYVFTSFLPFNDLSPELNKNSSLSILYKNIYFKPATEDDSLILLRFYKKRYEVKLSDDLEKYFLKLVDGHFQYAQLGLIALHNPEIKISKQDDIKRILLGDERIRLQSEEIWESLTANEQKILVKIASGNKILKQEKDKASYLWDVGMVVQRSGTNNIFSPLFSYFVKERVTEEAKDSGVEFSKKELLFFDYLKQNENQICERDKIVDTVWSEATELGISDWAIDKLAGRVRTKLKLQKSNFELQTVKTRGFKLIKP